jgi:hypothetical protein
MDNIREKCRLLRGSGSSTAQRVCEAFALIDDVSTFPTFIVGGKFMISQRIRLEGTKYTGSVATVRGINDDQLSFSCVLDNGELVAQVSPEEITVIDENVKNLRLDYVSRILWFQALSESRLPLLGEQVISPL